MIWLVLALISWTATVWFLTKLAERSKKMRDIFEKPLRGKWGLGGSE